MALTTGKKTTTVTPSSIASRMGVVPAYSGDWLATAADTLGKTLDTQAKKVAVLEEEKWKAQFSIDTYKAINDFAMKNRINPNGFTKNTDAYIDQLIQSVPSRYKGWAKQYAGMMAAREGQQIINRHYNTQQQDMIRLNADDTALWLDNTIRNLQSIPYAEWDQTMFTGHLAEFTEKAVAYENMFNALDPQYRGQIDTPQVWKRKHQLAFEQARLNSKHTALIEAAALIDREAITGKDENGDGVIYKPSGIEGELTNVQIAISKISTDLDKYINNPKVDELDGFATLRDTTTEERNFLKENSLTYANNLKQSYDVEQNKIKSMNEVQYNQNVNSLLNEVSLPSTNYSDDQLDIQLNNLNVKISDREKIKEANTIKNVVGNLSALTYNSLPEGKIATYNGKQVNLNQFNPNLFHDSITDAQTILQTEGINISYDDIKSKMIEHHIYTITGKNYNDLNFGYDFATGTGSDDFNLLKNYSINMGIVPKPLTNFINENYSEARLNLNVKENRDVIVEISGMLNALQETPYAKNFGIDNISAEDQILLTQFYKDYRRNFDINTKRSAGLQSTFIQENDFVKNWFEIRNEYEGDKSDKIITLFNNRINEIGDDVLDNILVDKIEKSQIEIFGVNFGSMAGPLSTQETVKPLIDIPLLRWLKINDTERSDLNVELGVQRFKEVLPDYLVNYYKAKNMSERDLALRTTQEIENDIGEIIQYVFSDLNSLGYGFE